MKKSILLTGAVMLMLASCSNEEILPNEEVKNPAEPTMTIIATQDEDAASRLAFVGEKNLEWTKGDQILVTEAEMPQNYVTLTLQETVQTKTGTFSTTDALPEKWMSDKTPLVAYYKSDATEIYSDEDGLFISQFYNYLDEEEGISSEYSFVQIQTVNNKMEHLTDFNHMKTESFTYTEKDVVNLKFSQQGAIMKFVLNGMGGETVKSLKLECGEEELPFFAMFYQIGTDIDEESMDWMCSTSTTLYLGENGEGITLDTDETLNAYLMLPTTEWLENSLGDYVEEFFAGLSFKLTATTENGPYTASVNGGKLGAGKFYTLTKEMQKVVLSLTGEGTEASPYQLSSKADLESLAAFVANGGSITGKHFQMTDDIDLQNTCPVIPTFDGIFDGNGKTIRNYVNEDGYSHEICLFHTIAESGEVKNLTLTGSNAGSTLGGFAYANYGIISGCTNEITMTDTNAGIAFKNYGTVIGCVNRGNISESSLYESVGGIVNRNNSGGVVKACYNLGTITITSDTGNSEAGGIAGYSYGSESSIIGCYNMGEITWSTQGGICGYAYGYAPTIQHCYWGNTSSTNAIGKDEVSTDVSTCQKVTGEGESTWAAAMAAMNTALEGSGWQYELNTDDATKATEPLKLEKTN